MREELKRYSQRHNLPELKEALKELFDLYNIVENAEHPQVSETCSQVPEEGTRSSDDDVRSSTSTIGARKIKPKSLNSDVAFSQFAAEPAKETLKRNPGTKVRKSMNSNSASSRNIPDNGARKLQKKGQKPMKEGSNIEKEKIKKQGEKPAIQEGSIQLYSMIAICTSSSIFREKKKHKFNQFLNNGTLHVQIWMQLRLYKM